MSLGDLVLGSSQIQLMTKPPQKLLLSLKAAADHIKSG